MLLTESLLAALLLQLETVPPEWLTMVRAENRWPVVAAALAGIAVDWEILDPRELPYVLSQPEAFPADLQMLRQRYRELADAPPLSDTLLFPCRQQIQPWLAFNRACARWFDEHYRGRFIPADKLAYRQELDEGYRIWDMLREAQCEYYMITVRRQCLKQLRHMLGEEAYRRSELPPPVPVHRFEWRQP